MRFARRGRGGGGGATLVPALLVLAVVPALLAGCDRLALSADVREATGIVTRVDGADAARVERFSLRTSEGAELDFLVGDLRVDRDAFPAAHLSEHLVTLEPVRVQYVERDGERVAVRLSDAQAR